MKSQKKRTDILQWKQDREGVADATSWAARRPPGSPALPEVWPQYLAESAKHTLPELSRLRSFAGRAFVLPIRQALLDHEPARALRLLAAAMLSSEDPQLERVPELWAEGARSLLQGPLCGVLPPTPAVPLEDCGQQFWEIGASATRAARFDGAGRLTLYELPHGRALWTVDLSVQLHRFDHVSEALITTARFGPDAKRCLPWVRTTASERTHAASIPVRS